MIPYMTPKGVPFVINGAERVDRFSVAQITGCILRTEYSCQWYEACIPRRIIPFKGSWIEFATDINNVMYAYIDRKKEITGNDPFTSYRF